MKREYCALLRTGIFVLSLLFLFSGISTWGNPEKLNRLVNVEVQSSEGGRAVIFNFEQPVLVSPLLQVVDRVIQLDVPGADTVPEKRTFSVDDPGVGQIVALQFGPDMLRTQIHTQIDPQVLQKNVDFQTDNNRITVLLKNPVPPPVVPEGAGSTAPQSESQTGNAPPETGSKPGENPAAGRDGAPVETAPTSSPESGVGVGEKNPDERPVLFSGRNGSGSSGTLDLSYTEPTVPETPGIFGAMMKMAAALAIVLAGFLFLSFGFKKFMNKSGQGFTGQGLIRVLGGNYVGLKQSILLVDVAGEVLVLGLSNNQVSMLTKIENPETLARIQNSQRTALGTGSKSAFGSMVKFFRGSEDPYAARDQAASAVSAPLAGGIPPLEITQSREDLLDELRRTIRKHAQSGSNA